MKLGYVVLGPSSSGTVGRGKSRLDGVSYNLSADYERARVRAGLKREDDW